MQVSSSQSAVYHPEELLLLGKVFDDVVQSLRSERTPHNRRAIARSLLACFLSGERDPEVLRQAALMNLTVAVAA
jgi:hypothetical protein